MKLNKLIPINLCSFIILAATGSSAQAAYYFACSPPPLVERISYYSSECDRCARPTPKYKYYYSCSKPRFKKHKVHRKVHHWYAKPVRRHSSYRVSVYVTPAVSPCYSCVEPVYSQPAPCERCVTVHWRAPYNDTYYEYASPYYYRGDYNQDMRTDDDIRAEMNIDD